MIYPEVVLFFVSLSQTKLQDKFLRALVGPRGGDKNVTIDIIMVKTKKVNKNRSKLFGIVINPELDERMSWKIFQV